MYSDVAFSYHQHQVTCRHCDSKMNITLINTQALAAAREFGVQPHLYCNPCSISSAYMRFGHLSRLRVIERFVQTPIRTPTKRHQK